MLKILAIGNSFSQDATAYLHDIVMADNEESKIVNLYIPGCSLKTHWKNIKNEQAAYEYELNGLRTGRMVSIKEALKEDEWDFITLQQVSNDSGIYKSFYPYIRNIRDYVKHKVPGAKILLHETWAYEIDSCHFAFIKYGFNQKKMFQAILDTYNRVSKDLLLDIIPSGHVIQALRELPVFDYAGGGISLCRDGFHMSLFYGRFAVAAVWYEKLFGKSILENQFIPPAIDGMEAEEKVFSLIKETVHISVK